MVPNVPLWNFICIEITIHLPYVISFPCFIWITNKTFLWLIVITANEFHLPAIQETKIESILNIMARFIVKQNPNLPLYIVHFSYGSKATTT